VDLDWCPAWLSAQRAKLPAIATSLQIFGGSVCDEGTFNKLYDLVASYVRDNRGFSIDDVIEHL